MKFLQTCAFFRSGRPLRREIAIALTVKALVILGAAMFVFSPSKPRIGPQQVERRLQLNRDASSPLPLPLSASLLRTVP